MHFLVFCDNRPDAAFDASFPILRIYLNYGKTKDTIFYLYVPLYYYPSFSYFPDTFSSATYSTATKHGLFLQNYGQQNY